MVPGKITYTIERFLMRENPSSALGYEVLIDGWFHADHDVAHMTLSLDGNAAPPFLVEETARPSADVAQAQGPAAANRRFLLIGPLTPDVIPFKRASLCVTLRTGDRCEIEIGHIFRNEVTPRQKSYADLVEPFESLGENSEFGQLQLMGGVERAGLFRFADCRSALLLAEAIDDRFAGFAESLQISTHNDEWTATDHRFGFVKHTGVHRTALTEAQIREQEAAGLPLLARMFMNDLTQGERIYVRCAHGQDAELGMLDLFNAMRRLGPARLLWVTLPDGRNGPGTIRRLGDGLYRGYIARFAPSDGFSAVPVESWTALLTEALKTIVAPAPEPLRPPRPLAELAPANLPHASLPHASLPHASLPHASLPHEWALSAPPRAPEIGRRSSWRKLFGGQK
jgi:hypothetical protein